MEITNESIHEFLETIEEPRKKDILTLIEMGKRLTKKDPKLWGTIIGFGNLHYRYKTGHEGNMPLIGFANRKQAITLYISFTLDKHDELNHLGKFKKSVGCLYVKKLSDINLDVLETLILKANEDTLKMSIITDNEAK